MNTITIPKKEYKRLLNKAKAYDKIAGNFFKNVIDDPVDKVVNDFKKEGLYTDEFLSELGDGLRKSSYAKKKK